MTIERNCGSDLMKIVLMLFIITHHIMLRGLGVRGLESGDFDNHYTIYAILNSFLIVAVNCYFLTSGYYGIKYRINKVLKLLFATYVIYWVLNIANGLFNGFCLDIEFFLGMSFPINKYWFILVYIILSLIAPALNVIIEKFDRKDFLSILIPLVVVYCGYAFIIDHSALGANKGYSLPFAIILYLIGGYIRRFSKFDKIRPSYAISGYFLCSILLSSVVFVLITKSMYQSAWMMFSYNNPLVLVGSIMLFLAFKNFQIKNKIIPNISKYTLYIYIVHCTSVVFRPVIDSFLCVKTNNDLYNILLLIIYAVSLFILGVIVGIMFEYLYTKLERLITRILSYEQKN